MSLTQELLGILRQGKAAFGLAVGIVSQIEGQDYLVVAIDSDYEELRAGDVYELGDTYCLDVALKRQVMTYADVAQISDMLKHPVYLYLQLRAYIGAPIMVHGEFWGTLNFSSKKPRESAFSAADVGLIEQLAKQAAKAIETTVQG